MVNRETVCKYILYFITSGICLGICIIIALNTCDPNIHSSCSGRDIRNLTVEDISVVPNICSRCVSYNAIMSGGGCATEQTYPCMTLKVISGHDNFVCSTNISTNDNEIDFYHDKITYRIGSWHYFVNINGLYCTLVSPILYITWWTSSIIAICVSLTTCIFILYTTIPHICHYRRERKLLSSLHNIRYEYIS